MAATIMLFSLANRLEHAQLLKADGMSSVLHVSLYTTDVNQGFIQDFKLGGTMTRASWKHELLGACPPSDFYIL